jgi:hypothetical protein
LTCRRAALRAYTRRIPQRGLTTGVEESETRQSQEAGENTRAHTLSHTNSLGTRRPIKKVHKIQEQKFFAPVEFPVQSPLPPDIEDYLRMIAKYDRHLVKVSSRRNASGHRVCIHFDLRLTRQDSKERYSAPFSFEPNFSCVVECLPSCVAPGEKPTFPPTISGSVYVCVCVCIRHTAVGMVGSDVYVSFVYTCVRPGRVNVFVRASVPVYLFARVIVHVCVRARVCWRCSLTFKL